MLWRENGRMNWLQNGGLIAAFGAAGAREGGSCGRAAGGVADGDSSRGRARGLPGTTLVHARTDEGSVCNMGVFLSFFFFIGLFVYTLLSVLVFKGVDDFSYECANGCA